MSNFTIYIKTQIFKAQFFNSLFFSICVSFVGLFFLLSSSAYAQSNKLSIDDLVEVNEENLLDIDVTTASKTSENIKNAPGIISVITSTEIEKFGATNLLEIIEWTTSVYSVGNFYLPQNYISIRGDLSAEYNNHVLILINGRPSRENLFGGIDYAMFYGFPVSTIDRIEVIRGPGSVLYGSNAYSGVVNIITKDVKNDETNVSAEVGSFKKFGFNAVNTKLKDDIKLRTAIKYTREEGWLFESIGENLKEITGGAVPVEARDTASFNSGQNTIGGMFSANYKNFTFNSSLSYSSQEHYGVLPVKIFPAAPGDVVGEIRNRTISSLRGFLDLGYTFNYASNASLSLNATYNSNFARFATPTLPSGDAVIKSNDWLLELTNFYSPSEKINWLVGATAYFQSGNAETGDEEGRGVADFNETWYSAYTQIDYSPTSYLKLIAGGQLNKPAGIDLDFVPRLGAIINVTPQLGAKILYGKAFRSAFEAENSLIDIGVLVGNPDLIPEKVTTTDLQIFYFTKELQLTGTYFISKQKEIISRVPDPLGSTFENRDELSLNGFELEAKITPFERLFISASFTHQTNSLNDTIDGYTMAPENMAKIGVFYTLKNGTSIGLFNKYFGNAGTVESMSVVNPEAKAFNLLSLKLHFELNKLLKFKSNEKLGLDIFGNNLLDASIYYPEYVRRNINTIPGRAGRAFYGKLTFQF